MLNAFISVSLCLIGIFVSQYALGMYFRLRRVFIPLTAEIAQKVSIPPKMVSKQKTEHVMSVVIIFLMPLLVVSFSEQWWPLAPYFTGAAVGALMLRGKCERDDRNLYLYFHNYRIYLENELALRDDPAYGTYMAYRRRSLIEQALDAEEKKQVEEARRRNVASKNRKGEK